MPQPMFGVIMTLILGAIASISTCLIADRVFKPTRFEVKKGIPVRGETEGINVYGYTNEIVIPKLGISKKIEKDMKRIKIKLH